MRWVLAAASDRIDRSSPDSIQLWRSHGDLTVLAAALEDKLELPTDQVKAALRPGRRGTYMSSTTVPLTMQVLKPTMPLHDLPGGSGPGESLAKSSSGKACTFSVQARLVSSLTLL